MSMTSKYPPGSRVKYLPKPISVGHQARQGYLKQNVRVAKYLLEEARAGKKVLQTWQVAADLGIERKLQVEAAMSCMGLDVVYGAIRKGKKTVGVRRCVELDEKRIKHYLRLVKQWLREQEGK